MQLGMLGLGCMGASMAAIETGAPAHVLSAMRFQFGGHFEKPGNES